MFQCTKFLMNIYWICVRWNLVDFSLSLHSRHYLLYICSFRIILNCVQFLSVLLFILSILALIIWLNSQSHKSNIVLYLSTCALALLKPIHFYIHVLCALWTSTRINQLSKVIASKNFYIYTNKKKHKNNKHSGKNERKTYKPDN